MKEQALFLNCRKVQSQKGKKKEFIIVTLLFKEARLSKDYFVNGDAFSDSELELMKEWDFLQPIEATFKYDPRFSTPSLVDIEVV